eukprot:3314424-Alexandrium_andersonii.AAC.1
MRQKEKLRGGAGGSKSCRGLPGGATAPPDPPDWRLRRERPHRGGHRPPRPPRLAPPARLSRQSA